MRRLAPALPLLLSVLAACGPGPAPTPTGESLRMDFDADPLADFYAAPFPSEHRRNPDGTVDAAGFPNPLEIGLVDAIASLTVGAAGYGTTSGAFFTATAALDPSSLPADFAASVDDGASVFLVNVDPASPRYLERAPVAVGFLADGGNHGGANQLGVVPLQGFPLAPGALHAVVVTKGVLDATGAPLVAPASLAALAAGQSGGAAWEADYLAALDGVEAAGVPRADVVGLAAYRTWDPTSLFRDVVAQALAEEVPALDAAPALLETYPEFCVFQATVGMPTFQGGVPPYASEGGGWVVGADGKAVVQAVETAKVVVTVPRAAKPAGGYPLVVFSRTGGGGDRPLVDRGPHSVKGGPPEPGEGYARDFAEVGYAGLSIDGPHGGLRNVSNGDEQFLVYNVQNPEGLRDNIRQSALELVLAAELASTLSFDASACAGADPVATFDASRFAAMGHSMGATIYPLALAVEPRFRQAILSGAGSSFIENILYKQSPLQVKPLAELILGYEVDQHLNRFDPILSLLQWAGEPSDPPAYGADVLGGAAERHVMQFQGIVDTYILPPIAQATNLSLGLDLAGDALDDDGDPRLEGMTQVLPLLPLVGRKQVTFPVSQNGPNGRTAFVVQIEEDGIEDGHEIAYQSLNARAQARCFLQSGLAGVPVVPAPGAACP